MSSSSKFRTRVSEFLQALISSVLLQPKPGLLPESQLHPFIVAEICPAFWRGNYDRAVFQALRQVEIVVRQAGNFSAEVVGMKLMRDAFRPVNPNNPSAAPGPLTDTSLPVAEQEARANLYCGAIGLYKNPLSHRNVPIKAADAAAVIVFASHLLRMVEGASVFSCCSVLQKVKRRSEVQISAPT